MKWKNIILIGLLLILIAAMLFFYFTRDQPKQEQAQQFVNVSISAIKQTAPDTKLVVGYEIISKTASIDINGKTLKEGSIAETLPVGYAFTICSYNLPNEAKYYSNCKDFTTVQNQNLNLILNIVQPGLVKLYSKDVLTNDGGILNLDVSLENQNPYKHPFICINESFDIFTISIDSLQETNIPDLNNQYLYCYEFSNDLTSSNYSVKIPISYTTWNQLQLDDYIGVYIGDEDFINGHWVQQYNNTDVGGINENFMFRPYLK